MQSNFRHLMAQGGGSRRNESSDMSGMKLSGTSGHYRVDLSAGHLDLADLHTLAHPGVVGLPGFGGHHGDRGFDLIPQGLSSMLHPASAIRNPAFGAHSHFITTNGTGSPEDSCSAQNPSAHHPSEYLMRVKPSHNPYYGGASAHGLGSLSSDSPAHIDGVSEALSQQHIVHSSKRKWPVPGGGAHQDALTELARENLLLKHQLSVASQEVDRLKHVLEAYDITQEDGRHSSIKGQSRYWTEEEHQRFLDAIQNYGHKDVKAIASVVGTRNATQVRTHAQKYFIKLARSRKQSQTNGQLMNSDGTSNPDRDDMAEDVAEDLADTSLEAAAAAAAAAGEAGTSAAAAAAFVAATHSKHQQTSQHMSKRATRHEEMRLQHGPSNSKAIESLVSSNVEGLVSSVRSSVVAKLDRKSAKTSSRHRKSSASNKDAQAQGSGHGGGGPGSPGSMGSSGSLGSSDATSNGNGSNGSNGVRSSDTTNGNGSSNGSNSNGHCNENGSSGDSGGGVDSNNGVSSNEGSDHGFFDTAGEDGGNFSDELDGTVGGSEEGFHPLEHNSQPLEHASQPRHTQLCLPNGVYLSCVYVASRVAFLQSCTLLYKNSLPYSVAEWQQHDTTIFIHLLT